MDFLDRFINRNKPQEVVNNIPKEKEQMRKTFGVYCNKHHNTNGEKLCAKCTALLSTVMIKINRCPYGITKPICDKCEIMCFGSQKNNPKVDNDFGPGGPGRFRGGRPPMGPPPGR